MSFTGDIRKKKCWLQVFQMYVLVTCTAYWWWMHKIYSNQKQHWSSRSVTKVENHLYVWLYYPCTQHIADPFILLTLPSTIGIHSRFVLCTAKSDLLMSTSGIGKFLAIHWVIEMVPVRFYKGVFIFFFCLAQ